MMWEPHVTKENFMRPVKKMSGMLAKKFIPQFLKENEALEIS